MIEQVTLVEVRNYNLWVVSSLFNAKRVFPLANLSLQFYSVAVNHQGIIIGDLNQWTRVKVPRWLLRIHLSFLMQSS